MTLKVLSVIQNAAGDWVITFDGPKMERLQVTHRGELTHDVVRAYGDRLEQQMHKLPAERA